jgi:hypothetical protein
MKHTHTHTTLTAHSSCLGCSAVPCRAVPCCAVLEIKIQIFADWRKELDDVRAKFPMQYPDRDDVIAPQHAVEVGGGGFVWCGVWVCLRMCVCGRAAWARGKGTT